MGNNVKSEFELYEPMIKWLDTYLRDNYKGHEIITADVHSERLDRALSRLGVDNKHTIGIDIQIDVLGIARKGKHTKLIFVEAKKTNLTLRDLGQLWSYCKLIDPAEAFLLTSANLGTLDKILNVLKRKDLLNFGDGKLFKYMQVGKWDIKTNRPIHSTMVPKK